MIDPVTGGPHTYHTTNPVPLILRHENERVRLQPGGALRDIAPTMLGVTRPEPEPAEMTGRDLRIYKRHISCRVYGLAGGSSEHPSTGARPHNHNLWSTHAESVVTGHTRHLRRTPWRSLAPACVLPQTIRAALCRQMRVPAICQTTITSRRNCPTPIFSLATLSAPNNYARTQAKMDSFHGRPA